MDIRDYPEAFQDNETKPVPCSHHCESKAIADLKIELIQLSMRVIEITKQRDDLLTAIVDARHALQFANDTPNGPIIDTIWMMHGRNETLFDFMDAAIASVKGGA